MIVRILSGLAGLLFTAAVAAQSLPVRLLTVTSMAECGAFHRQCHEAQTGRLGVVQSCRRAADKKYGDRMGKYFRDVELCPGVVDFLPAECDASGREHCTASEYCQTEYLACLHAVGAGQAKARKEQEEQLRVPNNIVVAYGPHANEAIKEVRMDTVGSEQAKRNDRYRQRIDLARNLYKVFSGDTPQKDRLQTLAHLGIDGGSAAFRDNLVSRLLTRVAVDAVLESQMQAMADLEKAWRGNPAGPDSPQDFYRRSQVALSVGGTPLLAGLLANPNALEFRGRSVSQNLYVLDDAADREEEQRLAQERAYRQREFEQQQERARQAERERLAYEAQIAEDRRRRQALEQSRRERDADWESRQRQREYERENERERSSSSSSSSVLQGIMRGVVEGEAARHKAKQPSPSNGYSRPPSSSSRDPSMCYDINGRPKGPRKAGQPCEDY